MVKLVASRVAAIRLVWIVAVLLVPIMILGFFLVQNIQAQIDFIRSEQTGANFLAVISPVLLDAAEGKTTSANYDKLFAVGPELAQAAGSDGMLEPLLRLLRQPAVQPISVMKLTYEIIKQTSENSKIILDSSPETYYLGVAATQGMPDMVLRFKQLQYAADIASLDLSDAHLAAVASANGALLENVRLLQSQVNSAKTVDRSSFGYLPILGDFDIISKDNLRRANSILKSFQLQQSGPNLQKHELELDSSTTFDVHRSLWKKLFDRFVTLKDSQSEALTQRMLIVIAISLLSVLVGLGSAITMFNSTLRRLDDITQAQVAAEYARAEAEDMAGKLTTINDEMVTVNRELAYQMQMLKEAQDALVSKGRMEQLGQLTATIAHELRNPLGAVRTSAFLIERKIKGKELGFETQLARINNGVSRCDDIITQLLDFSRTKPLASRPADLDHWLAKIIEEEAKQLPSAVSIECDLNLQEQLVPFDPSRLQRAIINLLSNASEALVGKGDDPSRFANANPIIKISTEVNNGFAVLRIRDNGPGISAENLAKIREPLFTTKSFGTGLGLPAVEQIASQHHGRLEVSSTLGDGAEFSIFLPLNVVQESAA